MLRIYPIFKFIISISNLNFPTFKQIKRHARFSQQIIEINGKNIIFKKTYLKNLLTLLALNALQMTTC